MAIKRMPHATVKQRKANMQEVHFLRLLRGKPNIVNYYATFRKGEEVWVIMEFMEGGTLGQAAAKRALHEGHVAYLAREVLKGLVTIHAMNLVHRDLKPHNIMIDIDGGVKLIDFGLCVDLNKNKEPRSMVGSAFWMSPEMILRKPHGTASDIFSFGVVMFEVLLGKPITNHIHPIKAMYVNAVQGGPPITEARAANAANVTAAQKSSSTDDDIFGGLVTQSKTAWSEEAYDFVSQCLAFNPEKRPTAADLLKHPFLKTASDQREMRRILKVLFLSNSLSEATP
jgi:serine/threonine protein kinase